VLGLSAGVELTSDLAHWPERTAMVCWTEEFSCCAMLYSAMPPLDFKRKVPECWEIEKPIDSLLSHAQNPSLEPPTSTLQTLIP
jgi:hypothetical protein